MKKIIAMLLVFSMIFSGMTISDKVNAETQVPEYTEVTTHPVKGTLYAVQEEEESQSDTIYKRSSKAAYTLEDLGEIMNQQMENYLLGTGSPAAKVEEMSSAEKAQMGNGLQSKITFSLANYQIPYEPAYVVQYVYEAIGTYPNLSTLFTSIGVTSSSRGINSLIVFSPVAAGQMKSQISRYKKKFENLIAVPEQDSTMSDMEKLLYLHDEIVIRSTYDMGDGNDVTVHTPMALLLNGKAVCQSYAGVLNQAAKALGINSLQLASDDHAWNAVELDGKWYYLDATFDDPVGNLERDYVSHKYFLFNMDDIKTDASVTSSHTLDQINQILYGEITGNMGDAYRNILPKKLQVQMNYLSGSWYYGNNGNIYSWDGESQNGMVVSDIPSATDRACAVCGGKLYVSGSDGVFLCEDTTMKKIVDAEVSKMTIINGVMYYKTANGWSTEVLVEDLDELETETDGTPSSDPSQSPSPDPSQSPSPDLSQSPTPDPSQSSSSDTDTGSGSGAVQSVSSAQAPARVVISSVKNNKKKMITLKFKKVKKATGYQYSYATNKKFKSSKTKTTKKLTVTIKKLKKKKTYYVRVRAYSTVNNKKKYGEWSKVKSVKIKK